MLSSQTKRMVGWSSAVVVLIAAAGTYLAVHLAGAKPEGVALAQASGTPTHQDPAPHSDLQPVRVKVVRPSKEHLTRSTTQTAHVEPYEKTDIYAKVSGYLVKFGQVRGADGRVRDLDIGDLVEKEQVLAQLAVPEMEKDWEVKKALLRQAEADVKKYEAERVFREAELARLQEMVRDRSIQEAILDEKRLQRDSVLAAIAAARARAEVVAREIEQVEALLNYATIRAPYRGLITRRMADTGAFIQSAATGKPEPLFTIMRVDRLRIVTDIPESESAWLKIGQPAVLHVDAERGKQFAGHVARFSDSLDKATRTMRTEIELDGPADGLRPGMYGSVTIKLADYPDAVMLPTSCLEVSGSKPSVTVVEGQQAHRREIELGLNDGVRMQVIKGLNGGEAVITDGKSGLREGQPVEVVQ